MPSFSGVTRQVAETESMAASKKAKTREDWEKRLGDPKIRKEDMNKLVMNFLATEACVDAAVKFWKESGTEPDIVLATIKDRVAVKEAVLLGNVEDAIKKLNELNSEILKTNEELDFHLQQQRMIELIRKGMKKEALDLAEQELAPRSVKNHRFLDELQTTVSLLGFEDIPNSPLGYLLEASQRLKTASEVNAAILASRNRDKDPKLSSFLKRLLWAQDQLNEKATYPQIRNLLTATLEDLSV